MSVLAGSVAAALAAKGASNTAIIINVLVALSVSTLFTGILLYRGRRAAPRAMAALCALPSDRRFSGGVRPAADHRRHGGGDADQSDACAIELGNSLFARLWTSDRRRLAVCHLDLPHGTVGAELSCSAACLRRLPRRVRRGPVRLHARRNHTACLVPADLGELALWWPISAILRHEVDWGVIAQSSAEIGAVCGVMAIALLLDVSSLEVARQKSSDLDKEFRTNGIANLLASVVGGFAGSLSMNGCLLLDEFGATTRWAGAIRRHRLRHHLVLRRRHRQRRAEGHSRRHARLSRRRDPRRARRFARAALLDGRVTRLGDDARDRAISATSWASCSASSAHA